MTTRSNLATAPAVTSGATGELRALTGLRIVAAVWVVLFHFHFTALPGVKDVVSVVGPLITAGALGVDLFFVLSGFVIAYTYLDKMGRRVDVGSAARFVWARACRLWPAYVVVFNLFGLWLGARLLFGNDDQIAYQGVQPVVSVGEWVKQLFMVQLWDHEFFDGASWVGSTWSISAEWLAYVLFPIAAVVFYRLRNLPRPVLALGALAFMGPIAWAYLSTGSPYYPWSWMVRILCGFGGGVLTYLVVRRIPATAAVRRVASLLATATPVLIAAGLWFGELLGPGRGGAVIVLFPLLVGSMAVADRGVARLLSARWAVYGGRVSYSLYLVHIPILEVYWLAMAYFPSLWQPTLRAHIIGAVAVLVTFPVAQLLFHRIEEPSRLRMRDWVGARRPARAVEPAAVAPAPVQERDPVALALRTAAATGLPVDAPAPRSIPEPSEGRQAGNSAWFTPAVPSTGPGWGPVPVPATSIDPIVIRPSPRPRHSSTSPLQIAVAAAAALESRERRAAHRAWVQATR